MADDNSLALYVHWPFCVSKCPYCDFNSHVREGVDQAQWRAALLADLAHEARALPGRRVSSIFFGGGTPSLMPPGTVAAVIGAAEAAWGFADGVEITLEANPSSVEAARFGDIAAAGVNRVSLGLQALDDAALRFLGRAHDVDEGLRALETAQAAFARVSFDLIYARPGQAVAEWERELARALAFGTEHLSLYQLTIEPGTRFATEAAAGRLTIPDGDAAADLYEATQAMTAAAGLPPYEISNHARRGAESRHNLAYWRYRDYAGIGPGAHGRRLGHATRRRRKPENWLAAIDRNGHGIEAEEALPPAMQAEEALLMGLRLAEGVDLARIARLGQRPAGELVDLGAVARLPEMVRLAGDRLTVLPAGMLLLDAILPAIVRAG
ncbi:MULTISPECIES: radical SAM family heme chaperone HemW [unclassified Sphingomonas]|uniref:radical SAM family heme chaperone HemW n=1 Tax=unclassified Sphingomonas TaxID=196159 RepID=UPI00092AE469|nr:MULTISPECIES: radical SAM family heme chaperone HemW [unclassified Sphingomonas]MBN8850090.1 coproporphyrinogen III oxidase [Sphingomonas sp.]OJV33524.1 MAG: coproporphyrinogen III oxidase [Sphingomonas sp. 67-36]